MDCLVQDQIICSCLPKHKDLIEFLSVSIVYWVNKITGVTIIPILLV